MSWQARVFIPVLHEARKYDVQGREVVARINVYRHDDLQQCFYELSAEAADDARLEFLKPERAFVPQLVSRSGAVHFASRKALEWFTKVEAAVKAANAPPHQNGVSASSSGV